MMPVSALMTDLYELTMAQGYFRFGLDRPAVFDMFFRRQPFGGGFSIFAGLAPLLEALRGLHFSAEDLAYLESQKIFERDFLDYLAGFRFKGDVWAMPEGTPVFPQEPLVRVHASLVEAQLVEGLLLCMLNFQSLVATKAARVYEASHGGTILEFGLRRAQGVDGALSASRAAYLGGASATSNTLAGRTYGIPVAGTMAHSWVMAFTDETEAFEKYAELYPDKTILLIDTFNTLKSGLAHAIPVGRRLAAMGKSFGVRLDSGDIQYLSMQVRQALDAAGLTDAKIAVSNELDEHIVRELVAAGCPIDIWGVGTHLVTGGSDSSFTGVYKLVQKQVGGKDVPTMKVSDNPEKSTNPGVKQVWRFFDECGSPLADLVGLHDETVGTARSWTFHHPSVDSRSFSLEARGEVRPLLSQVMRAGELSAAEPALADLRGQTLKNLSALDLTYKRLLNPHLFKVSISSRLRELKLSLMNRP
jgi:nicotinate phosphoribosyltransferase